MNNTQDKKQAAAYGTWPSIITTDLLTQGITGLNEPQIDGNDYYWLESRPERQGRSTIVQQNQEGNVQDITPEHMNVRTRAHEYGGAAYRVHRGTVYFINDDDQQIYAIEAHSETETPRVLSPKGHYRFADICIDETREQLICVCEIHKSSKQEPENCIVSIKLDGSSTLGFNILCFGNDFYSNPRVSPDGIYISWLTWNHPNMPWDSSECWIAEFSSFGLLQKQHKVAGSSESGMGGESIFQPRWSPTGELFFVSDRSNWWNLFRFKPNTKSIDCILKKEAEFATPQWVFGMSTYDFLNSFTLLCTYTENGRWHLAKIDTLTGHFTKIVQPHSSLSYLACNDETDTAVFIAANEDSLNEIILWKENNSHCLKKSAELPLDIETFSHPNEITYTNSKQQAVHGFYYPPHNPLFEDTSSDLPPLLVVCHGGPTGATSTALNLKIQYWTNRGFAVFDINYSGSTGYGREYRDRLKGQWGILDVADICDGADYLVKQNLADPKRLAVRGSSAGGYTVLAALTFNNRFTVGASLYGIGDLCLLAEDTHKFESRYLDQLIGPFPQDKTVYIERSPINHIEKLQCPVIFLQGLQDKIVPPNQAETMVNALFKKSVPVALVTFEEEGHGFRQADNIKYAMDVEYAFYASEFSLEVSESLPKVPYVTESIDKDK